MVCSEEDLQPLTSPPPCLYDSLTSSALLKDFGKYFCQLFGETWTVSNFFYLQFTFYPVSFLDV